MDDFVNYVEVAEWKVPTDVKAFSADIIHVDPGILQSGDSRVVFDILGNSFRLVAHVSYSKKILFCKWFGTHVEYDKLDLKKETFK